MNVRAGLGLVAGVILLLSAAAHSYLGWRVLRARLLDTAAPPDLVTGLGLGWHFAGLAMLVFGVNVIMLFVQVLKGRAVSRRPALVIGAAYVLFGGWAFAATQGDPFFMIFITPGVLLVAASASWLDRRP
jgi:hypothetical protein